MRNGEIMATTYKSKVSEGHWHIWHSNVNGDELLHTFTTEEEADYYLATGRKLISKTMVEGWLGSDNMSTDDFLDLITDIINEDYPLDILRSDVLEFMENENA
jgi:hypothetical protein